MILYDCGLKYMGLRSLSGRVIRIQVRAVGSKLLIYMDPFLLWCFKWTTKIVLSHQDYIYIDLHFCINDGKYHTWKKFYMFNN